MRTDGAALVMQLETPILTEYVYVLARIALADKQLFLMLVNATAAARNVKESQVWEPILDQWWTRVRSSLLFPFSSFLSPEVPDRPQCSSTTCPSRACAS